MKLVNDSTSKPTKKQPNKSSPKVCTNVWDRTANGKQIFIKYSKYHNSSLLLKDLHKASETENEKIVSHVNDSLTQLSKKKFLKMKS